MSPPPTPPKSSRRARVQFSLASILFVTVLASVLCGVLAGMLRGSAGPVRLDARFFVLVAAALPVALVILISAMRWLMDRWGGKR